MWKILTITFTFLVMAMSQEDSGEFLTDQLTLSQPGGADYAHHSTTSPPGFSDLATGLYSNEEIADIIQQFNETLEAEKLEKVPVLLTVTSLVILNMPQ